MVAAKAVHPAATGELVSHSASIGKAMVLIRVPSTDMDEPASNSRNDRPLTTEELLHSVSANSDIRH